MTHLSTTVEIAAELRRKAGQTRPPFSTRKIIETLFPAILVTGGNLPSGIDEIVSPLRGGPIIVYERKLSIPEQRLAIAHGLSHLLFDDDSACMRVGHAGITASEDRADRFAVELLVPRNMLRREIARLPSSDHEEHEIYLDHRDAMASTFGVPTTAIDAQIRLLMLTCDFVSRLRLTNW